MIESIPQQLRDKIRTSLEHNLGFSNELIDFQFSSGGCINRAGKLLCSSGNFFLKWNSKSKFEKMFLMEEKGLKELIKADHNLKIAKPILHGDDGENSFLILEFIDQSNREVKYWQDLGGGLASLHRNIGEKFGLADDNYIGSLVQKNEYSDDWLEFFRSSRIEFMFKQGMDRGFFTTKDQNSLTKLFNELPNICPSEVSPSLMHGDLWSGNLIVSESGGPCLIDPAVYYGFREMEIAFTELFGGFADEFYKSYNEHWPLEPGYEERKDIWNLYPLLVHVNIFGQSYVSSVNSILKRFV